MGKILLPFIFSFIALCVLIQQGECRNVPENGLNHHHLTRRGLTAVIENHICCILCVFPAVSSIPGVCDGITYEEETDGDVYYFRCVQKIHIDVGFGSDECSDSSSGGDSEISDSDDISSISIGGDSFGSDDGSDSFGEPAGSDEDIGGGLVVSGEGGFSGSDGSSVSSGDDDSTGLSGDDDSTGISGDDDSTGVSGDDDSTGVSGDDDSTGVSGDDDSTGISGDDDSTGVSGDDDSTGVSEDGGFSGSDGESISSGDSDGSSIIAIDDGNDSPGGDDGSDSFGGDGESDSSGDDDSTGVSGEGGFSGSDGGGNGSEGDDGSIGTGGDDAGDIGSDDGSDDSTVVPEGEMTIENRALGLCLDASEYQVRALPCDNSPPQTWVVEGTTIRNSNGNVMDVQYGCGRSNTIITYPANDGQNQQFEITPQGIILTNCDNNLSVQVDTDGVSVVTGDGSEPNEYNQFSFQSITV